MSTPVVVTRHRCDWCGQTRASKSRVVAHERVCHKNPASRACSTCVHFERTPCCQYASDDCGCKGLNECAVGAFVTWKFDDHQTHTSKADGWWTHTEDFRRDCDKWEPTA